MVYYFSVWKYHTADFALHRLIFACSFLPGCACATLAIIQRCAVVLMRDRAWRRRFVRSLGIVCFIACVILQSSAVLFVWTLRNEHTPSAWYNERRTHIWSLPAVALFPIITIVSALWSIKVYNEQSGSASAGASAIAAAGAGGGGGGGMVGNTRTGKGGMGSKSEKWRRPSLATVRSISHDDPPSISTGPHAGSIATSGISSSHSQPSYMVPRKASKSTPVTRPLTIAFNVMTCCIVLEWIATMVISTFNSVGIVKSPAVLSLVGALGIVTESLFETVMQVVHQRVRRDPDDHCVQSNTEDGKRDADSQPAAEKAAHISVVEGSASVLGRTESNATTAGGKNGVVVASRDGASEGSVPQSIPPRLLSRQ
ncbi:hypothetical protein BCR44DRAFT_34990 [Catenaria anguillulae PL171]|uniref:Uncharacterized protein n=1 Tax=Catenaria anguillulae PL171 TaxID=765915 RepID=A0A1Y2HAK9_9FUNG|nr:hypothetical protein BCR44DRAFT_34990 [Catenaria anguillulae PL171]